YLMVSTSLEHGHTAVSAYGYTLYGLMLAAMGDAPQGYQFGQLGMFLTERYPDPGIIVRARHMFAICMNPYFNPLATNLKYHKTTYQLAPQAGDIPYFMASAMFMTLVRTMKGDPLPEAFDDSSKYLGAMMQSGIRPLALPFLLHRQMLRALQGLTSAR